MRIMKLFRAINEYMESRPAIAQAFLCLKFKESSYELKLSLLPFNQCDVDWSKYATIQYNLIQFGYSNHIRCIGKHSRKDIQSTTDCWWNRRNGFGKCIEFIYRIKHTHTAEFVLLPQLLPKVSIEFIALKIVRINTDSNFSLIKKE